MGNTINRLVWGQDPDKVDTETGLTPRDIYNIQKSWKPVYDHASANGMELFLRTFRAKPESKALFLRIKDLDEEQIKTSHQFKAHVINFMSSWNMIILNLDQTEVVIAMLQKLRDSHQKHRVPAAHFDVLKDVLVNYLVTDLKSPHTVVQSWSRFITFAFPLIITREI